MIHIVLRIGAVLLAMGAIHPGAQGQPSAGQSSKVTVNQDGTVHVPAYEVPLSIYMSDDAKRAYIDASLHTPQIEPANDIVSMRKNTDRVLLMPQLARAKVAYPVLIEEHTIAGRRVDVVTPKEGVPKRNRERILINLHGGGFVIGAGVLQLIESIPIAATAQIKVLSIDYRLSPEHKFPAASEDVAAVYKALLKHYRPQNIGIYGSSAGGALTAMSVAWFQKEKLPPPGAIAILSPGDALAGGDSRYTAPPLNPLFGANAPAPPATPNPPPMPVASAYFTGVDLKDPLVSPTLHPQVLAQFPPTLLITGTRDFLASTVVQTHRQLVKAGVEADLHIWDGMWHAFYLDVDIPESKEMYEVAAKFFAAHLGSTEQAATQTVPSRVLPIPDTVSPEMQKALGLPAPVMPLNPQGWAALEAAQARSQKR